MKSKKIQRTIFETFTKKNLLQNFRKFYAGFFELEIVEILTTAFLLKTIISCYYKYCRVLPLTAKKKSKKRCKPSKNCCLTQQETEKQQQYLFLLLFYIEKFILCQKTFGKTQLIVLHLHYSAFLWLVMENPVIKHQRPYR